MKFFNCKTVDTSQYNFTTNSINTQSEHASLAKKIHKALTYGVTKKKSEEMSKFISALSIRPLSLVGKKQI
jgi:hypothetical protein